MKLKKLNLNELADAELNERAMCRILGGGKMGYDNPGIMCYFCT